MNLNRLISIVAALICGAATSFSQQPGALARLSVVSMRAEPRHSAEQVSQALMGTPCIILEKGPDWSRVQTPDGYQGWIINHSLAFKSPREMDQWANSRLMMVTAPFEIHDADRRTDLVHGDILQAVGPDSLRLPDGRMILAPKDAIMPLADVQARPFDASLLPLWAEQYLGVPYVWGGLSSKGMDCSGLVRMAFAAQGRTLPRDAWQQALEGREVPADSLRPGDLIFFGRKKITHVAIYAGNGEFIHASELVRRNSLNPSSPIYLPLPPIKARRRINP
ncbi:MAG: SH3 domain-containing protein [Bacteroides sp.]|nr:SH3 domain-containing protein [Bacteroides sp.]